MVEPKFEGKVPSIQETFFSSVYGGQLSSVEPYLKLLGADINGVEEGTGLSAIHIAVGRNHLDMVRYLLDNKAAVKPDRHGRWPSTIAALCEADGEICDLIADAEKAIGDV